MSKTYKKYSVKPGDTLYKIITRFYGGFSGKTLDLVMQVNNIKNPDAITVGQELHLPGNWVGLVRTSENIGDKKISSMVKKIEASDTPKVKRRGSGGVWIPLQEDDYWKEKFHKNLVVLHFTAGNSAAGAIATFKKPGRVATPYVVDKDGTLSELFNPVYWSYHLGVGGGKNPNHIHDKRSIPIEIVNIGPVWRKDGKWVDYVGKVHPDNEVVPGKNRDADGGVRFTEAQYVSTFKLISYLLDNFDIPREFPSEPMLYQIDDMQRHEGVATHQMFRLDKYDMGPAWDYGRMCRECGLEIF